jgi:hypothetical protein
MKSRKLVWIGVLCALSATVIIISHRAGSIGVSGALHSVSRASLAQPAAYMSNAALRAAAVSNAMLLDDDADPMRVTAGQQANRSVLPEVEEFTLTPPNPAQSISKTILSVRFPELAAKQLASFIPMKLGSQNVVLQRAAMDPRVFITSFDFDWQSFAQEQTQRKEGASRGRMVPVFNGRHFVRTEKMQFVDPTQIESALQSHQPIQFSGDVLLGSSDVDVFPDHELMMTALAVVDNPSFTFDQCQQAGGQGTQNGPWTFSALMMAIANTSSRQVAENMLLGMLNQWNQNQTVNNNFTVLARTNMGQLNIPNVQTGAGLLGNWPIDSTLSDTACTGLNGPTACPSLLFAPVRLDAIVNRIDLGENGSPFPAAGELRFVFTVTTGLFVAQNQTQANPCAQSSPFNIILEYNVPNSFDAQSWANEWFSLRDLNDAGTFSTNYLNDLEALSQLVVQPNLCNGGTCLAQIRTNELLLAPEGQFVANDNMWEEREFHFSNATGTPVLSEATVAMTPDPQFNTAGKPICSDINNINNEPGPCTSGSLANYINVIANNTTFQTTQGAAPPVPMDWTVKGANGPFLGGSALNGPDPDATAFWDDTATINSETARIDFSANTCNGCHGAETHTAFQQVFSRSVASPKASNLSNFLLGCVNNTQTHPEDSCSPTTPSDPQCSLSTEDLGENPTNSCLETVPDPNLNAPPNTSTTFGDIARRVVYFQTACGNLTCTSGTGSEMLVPFVSRPIGVH